MKFILFILLSTHIFSQHKYPADSLLKSNQISIIKKFGIVPISIWQRISYNTTIFDCQFYPSCSNYGSEAIRDFGLVKGGFVAADRITRCNPFAYHYHLELNRPFFEKDGRLIDPVHQKYIKNPSKSPLVAGFLSSILPGSGRMYSGKIMDGVLGMTNFFFIGRLALKKVHDQDITAGIILTTTTFYLWGSEIYGAWRQAKYYQSDKKILSR
jgi:uncharacterized protein